MSSRETQHNERQSSEVLNEIFLRTSEQAYRRKPHLHPPSRMRGRILDFGETPGDFCQCKKHVVPRKVFRVLADNRKEIILQHFSSRWLEETCAHIREMHALRGSSPTAWAQTVAEVRDFFGFNLFKTPALFQGWLGRALEIEVRVVDKWVERGLAAHRLVENWGKVAASLDQVFRQQLETLFRELRKEARRHRPITPVGTVLRESNKVKFEHSDDYREILLDRVRITATEQQAEDIKILHEAYISGKPEVAERRFTVGRLRDHFKPGGKISPLWGKLVIPGSKKKHYRLNV